MNKFDAAQKSLAAVWAETIRVAEKMDVIQRELGLPDFQ
jgi:hypothetical protein